MGQILRNWRIVSALAFSLLLIASAYLLTKGIQAPSRVEASTESELLEAISKKDSDGDGLTDWEEALYGTSPAVVDTKGLGMTDGEAVRKGLIVPKAISDTDLTPQSPGETDSDGLPPPPAEGTLTDAFVKSFMSLYLSAREANGSDLSEEELQNIAAQSLASLSSLVVVAPDYKSADDLKVSASGTDALLQYAKDAEAIMTKNTANAGKSEVLYLKDAVENEDTEALVHIASIAKSYQSVATGLAALPTPPELRDGALALINTAMRIGELSSDFSRLNEDPLATIVALEQYPDTVQKFASAFVAIGEVYQTSGVKLQKGEPGASFVNILQELQSP